MLNENMLQEWFGTRLEGVWRKKKMMGGQGILTVLVEERGRDGDKTG